MEHHPNPLPSSSSPGTLSRVIGNTPMLSIRYRYHGKSRVIFAKCEHTNLTGSIKDRMALHIIRRASLEGSLSPGDTIVEATSGNTGISLAALGCALGYRVKIFMPDWMSRERRQLITSYGADIVLVSKEQGGFLGSIALAEEFAEKEPHVFLPQQFSNTANIEAHELTTGPEIDLQLRAAGIGLDAFVAGVGTGGTVMGVGRYLRKGHPQIRIHPVEPIESPTLSIGHKIGKHRIQGISDEFIPPILELKELDEIISVSDGDSILMAQKLAQSLGLGVGISSGCNFLAAVHVQDQMGAAATVGTVFPDDNKKYLTTGLFEAEPIRDGYLSAGIELLGVQVQPRVCSMCSDLPRTPAEHHVRAQVDHCCPQ